MRRRYYRLWYRLDEVERYLIWYNVEDIEDDLDSVVLDEDRKIPVFDSLDALSLHAQFKDIPLVAEEPLLHDLDTIARWLEDAHYLPEIPKDADINCPDFLAAWNLFADVSRSIDGASTMSPTTRKTFIRSCSGETICPP